MQYVLVFILSLLFAVIGSYLSIVLAYKWNVLDYPGEIKIHGKPIPRMGGLGIVFGFIVGSFYGILIGQVGLSTGYAVIISALVVAVVGLIDDVRGLRPRQKLIGQLLGGIIFLVLTFKIFEVGSMSIILKLLLAVCSLFFVVGMSNSINLLDGMDGMAATLSFIIVGFLAYSLYINGNHGVMLMAVSLAAGCLGFLLYNLPPARTFMGDGGSLFLGVLIAVFAVWLLIDTGLNWYSLLGVLLILSIPIIDTGFACIRRLKSFSGVFQGDRFHLYDCLDKKIGHKAWLTLIVMGVLTIISGILGVLVMRIPTIQIVVTAVAYFVAVCFFAVWCGCLEIGRASCRERV